MAQLSLIDAIDSELYESETGLTSMIAAAHASGGTSDFITVAYAYEAYEETTITVFSVQLATPALTLISHERVTYEPDE